MYAGTLNEPFIRGDLLPQSAIGNAVAERALRVSGLLQARRRIAMAYRRTQCEDQRMALEQLDEDLAKHNIDLPAIHRRTHQHQSPAPRLAENG